MIVRAPKGGQYVRQGVQLPKDPFLNLGAPTRHRGLEEAGTGHSSPSWGSACHGQVPSNMLRCVSPHRALPPACEVGSGVAASLAPIPTPGARCISDLGLFGFWRGSRRAAHCVHIGRRPPWSLEQGSPASALRHMVGSPVHCRMLSNVPVCAHQCHQQPLSQSGQPKMSLHSQFFPEGHSLPRLRTTGLGHPGSIGAKTSSWEGSEQNLTF